MELRHLRYFVAVAEELHFRRAAERLYVAQPAVSEQVRKLELELGVKLFDRDRRNVSLTAAGAAFLDEAQRVLRQADLAVAVARDAEQQATMRLRLGYLPDSLPSFLPLALQRLSASAPNVMLQLDSGPALDLIEDLRAQRLDAVVTSLPVPTAGLRVTALDRQDAIVAVPAEEADAATTIHIAQLARERLLVPARKINPAFYGAMVSLWREESVGPTFTEVATVDDALLAVAVGDGSALLAESVAERRVAEGVRFVWLAGGQRALQNAVLTDPETENLATAALLRALAICAPRARPVVARDTAELVA